MVHGWRNPYFETELCWKIGEKMEVVESCEAWRWRWDTEASAGSGRGPPRHRSFVALIVGCYHKINSKNEMLWLPSMSQLIGREVYFFLSWDELGDKKGWAPFLQEMVTH